MILFYNLTNNKKLKTTYYVMKSTKKINALHSGKVGKWIKLLFVVITF